MKKQRTKTPTKNIWYTYQCAYRFSGHPNSLISETLTRAGHAPCKYKSKVIYVLKSLCPDSLKYTYL